MDLYPGKPGAEVAEALNSRHGNGRSANSVNQRARSLGVSKNEGYVRTMPRRMWPDEKREWFRAYAPGHTEREISAEHERIYGTPLTEAQIGNAKTSFGVRSGTFGGRFEKGMTPHNKGKTWDEQGISPEAQARSRSTCFKKGEVHDRPDGWIKPVGYERVNKDGYIEVKVMDSRVDGIQPQVPGEFNRNYRMKHHVVWEQRNGPIPPSTMIVFADGDKRNFDPDNLVAVPRRLWAIISRRHMAFWDAESLRATMNVAELISARRRAQMRPRECTGCGREFAPRYPHQRRCDPCIEIHGTGRK